MQKDVDVEIAIFDDASSDNTRDLAHTFADVRWHFAESSLGVSKARNFLMQIDGFEFYCSLDDDSWFLESDALAKGVDIMRSDSTIAAIAFDILSPDQPNRNTRSTQFSVRDFIGCGHLLRLSVVRAAGYYQQMPGFYGGEEKDLSIKLLDLGYKIMKTPGVHVWHDKTNKARDPRKQHRSGVCNDLVFFFRRAPLIILSLGLLYRVFQHLKFGVQSKLFRSTWGGIIDFFGLFVTRKLKRVPVSVVTFRRFMELPGA
jgi:GT2 family glycosyltransferase